MAGHAAQGGEARPIEKHQIVGRIMGPAIFVLMLVAGEVQTVMPDAAWRAAAVGLWMAVWWATEAIPVPATALLPLVLFG
ncbi:MAG: hypothetical protein AAGA33_14985, partial [Pseudomonadota bacterium]